MSGSVLMYSLLDAVTGWTHDAKNPPSDARIAAFLGVPVAERSWSTSFVPLSFEPALIAQPLNAALPPG